MKMESVPELDENVNDQLQSMTDITSIIETCASSLSFSEPFLSTESFSLLDSMAALELMDPSMDCCEIREFSEDNGNDDTNKNQSSKPISRQTPQDGLSSFGGIPWDKLTMAQARDITLEALVRFEAYMDAASIAESIYTCLYMHDSVLRDMKNRLAPHLPSCFRSAIEADGLESSTLFDMESEGISSKNNNTYGEEELDITYLAQLSVFAAALSIIKLTEKIRTIVQNADIYEEEDFSPNSYSFLFFPGVGENDVITLLDHVLLELAKVEGNDDQGLAVLAINRMLGFVKHFFESSSILAKMSCETVREEAKNVQSLAGTGVILIENLCEMDFFPKEKNTISQTPLILSETFDDLINRHLLGNAPVRKINFKHSFVAITKIKSILTEQSIHICDVLLHATSLHRIKRALTHISSSSTNILTRSLLVLNLYFDDMIFGQHQLPPLIAQSMNQLCGTPQSLTSTEFGASFLGRLGKPIYDTCKLLLLNRNRQRQYIDSLMLKEWRNLQAEANKLDFYFRQKFGLSPSNTPTFMTNYVLSHTIWIMEHYLSLAIELQLWNGGYDLSIAYWYWDFLLSTQMNVWTAMRNAKMERLAIEAQIKKEDEAIHPNPSLRQQQAFPKSGKKKGKGAKKSGTKQQSQSPPITPVKITPSLNLKDDKDIGISFMVLSLRRTLCRGIVRFIAALIQAKVVKVPEYEFTTHAYRFQKRFDVFGTLPQPPQLTFADYVQGSDFSNVTPGDLISSAAECFKTAKTIIDKLLEEIGKSASTCSPIQKEEVMKLAKVCVGNALFLHKLRQVVENNQTEGEYTTNATVLFDFGAHKQFCSMKVDK